MPDELPREDAGISGYALAAQIAARLHVAGNVEEAGRSTYLGAAAAVGGLGIVAGVLDAVDTLENRELEWVISFAVYGAVVLGVMLYLLWHVIRIATKNTDAARGALGSQITYLLEFAGKIPPDSNETAGLPSITSLRYNKGKAGELVTVTGTGFSDPAQVLFGSAPADLKDLNDSSMIVEVPENSGKTTGTLVHVAVVTAAGRSADGPQTEFTYVQQGTALPLAGNDAADAGPSRRGGDEFHAGAAAGLLAENAGHRVGQPGDEPGGGLGAAGAGQGGFTDAERDRRRGIVGRLPADPPASPGYAVEVDDHHVAGPLAVHVGHRVGQGADQCLLAACELRLRHAGRQVWHSRVLSLLSKKL